MPLTLTQVKNSLSSRLLIFQGGPEPFFSDKTIKAYLQDAIVEYQKIIPYHQKYALTLVAGDNEYDWPNDAIDIMPCAFGTDDSSLYVLTPLNSSDVNAEQYYSAFSNTTFQSPANITRNNIFKAFNAGQRNGNIEIDYTQKKIVIHPTPQEAKVIYIIYQENYPATETEADAELAYDDILDIHFRPIMDMVESLCYNALADAFMAKAAKVGGRDYRSENKAEFYQKKSKALEIKFRKAFPISAVSRT